MLALGQMSEDRVAAFVVKTGQESLSWNRIAKDLGIPSSTLHDLVTGRKRALRQDTHRQRLHEEASRTLSFPWSHDAGEHRDTVKADIEYLVSSYGNDRFAQNRITFWHDQTKKFWIDHALDPKATPVDRLVYGRLGAYLTLAVTKNRAVRNALPATTVEAIDADNRLSDLGTVYQAVGELIAEDQAHTLFEGDFSPRKQRGARWLRFLNWNDYQGWLILSKRAICPKAVEERNQQMKRLIQQGFVAEARWAAEITEYNDLTPVKNPWSILLLAGEWSASVDQAQTLFKAYPKHLTKRCQGEEPIINDRDNWPGLAAIANHPLVPSLGEIRDWLANADGHGHPKLKKALELMKPLVANGRSHQEVMNVLEGVK
jgi:hypothetical protein